MNRTHLLMYGGLTAAALVLSPTASGALLITDGRRVASTSRQIVDPDVIVDSALVEADRGLFFEAAAPTGTGASSANAYQRSTLHDFNATTSAFSRGRVVGDVKTSRILISDGAAFKGSVDMDV